MDILKKKDLLLSLMILIFASSFVFANCGYCGTDGTIRGQVLDVNGEPIPGVQILIEELSQGAITDLDGNYIILNVQVGTYDVRASMIGYATVKIQGVNVTMDQTRWLNFHNASSTSLREEAIEGEVVEVTGERGLIEVVEKKSSALVTSIPKSGEIEGFVITSCGMCNFGYKKIRGCNLTVKIGDTVYPVEGSGMHDHGDPHSSEGFCNTIRIAHVTGKIKKGKFYSNSFTLIESPN